MWTLVVRPDGKAILATEQELSQATMQYVREAIKAWGERFDNTEVLIIPQCTVVQVSVVELEVPDESAAAATL